jgi:predicted site-specific integrase-resolvase
VTRKAVCYARKSTAEEGPAESRSVARQVEDCRAFIERKGWTHVADYCDDAVSGGTFKRPAFLKMMADAKARKFDTVVFTQRDRFSRKAWSDGTYDYYKKLATFGVTCFDIEGNAVDVRDELVETVRAHAPRSIARRSASTRALRCGTWSPRATQSAALCSAIGTKASASSGALSSSQPRPRSSSASSRPWPRARRSTAWRTS